MPYKDPEVHKAYRVKRMAEQLDFIRKYKVEKGCADCGWNEHHAGLEFDHISEKFKNVSEMIRYTKQRLLDEIAKCEVVCGTCHNIRTWNRKQELDKAV